MKFLHVLFGGSIFIYIQFHLDTIFNNLVVDFKYKLKVLLM
jgi:hypothetical protein